MDIKDRLDEVHSLVVDHIEDALKSDDYKTRAEVLRDALQLLRQNQISASALPENPSGRVAAIVGLIDTSKLDKKLQVRKALPTTAGGLQPLGDLATTDEAKSEAVEVDLAGLGKPKP